jgi:hypothetical protein
MLIARGFEIREPDGTPRFLGIDIAAQKSTAYAPPSVTSDLALARENGRSYPRQKGARKRRQKAAKFFVI